MLPLLATQNQTWAVDLLGFGFTDRPKEIKISPKAIAIHLYSFWKTLIDQPVILVGASMGGSTAIDFTLTHPEAVKKLVLIDSAGFSAGPAMGKYLFPPLGYLATQFLRNPKIRASISRTAYKDRSLASLDAQLCAALHLNMPFWDRALICYKELTHSLPCCPIPASSKDVGIFLSTGVTSGLANLTLLSGTFAKLIAAPKSRSII